MRESLPEGASPDKLVSIVIPTVRLDYLEACLASIEAGRAGYPDFEIIVVNDGSKDPAFRSFLDGSPYRVVHLNENVGFSRANNAGFRVAQGAYLMTLNADTVVHPGWLAAMIDVLRQDPAIGAVGPTILEWNSDVIQSAGAIWQALDYRKFYSYLAGRRLSRCPVVQHAYPVDGLMGVCVLFRREALFAVGLFDEAYVNGWEDLDIGLGILKAGYRLYHAPGIIEHKGSFVRSGFANREYERIIRQNRGRFMGKWSGAVIRNHRLEPAGMLDAAVRAVGEGYHRTRIAVRNLARSVTHR